MYVRSQLQAASSRRAVAKCAVLSQPILFTAISWCGTKVAHERSRARLTYTNADAEGGDDFLDEVERVRRDGCVGDSGAVVEGDHVALGEPGAQLPEHLLVPVLAEPHHLGTVHFVGIIASRSSELELRATPSLLLGTSQKLGVWK